MNRFTNKTYPTSRPTVDLRIFTFIAAALIITLGPAAIAAELPVAAPEIVEPMFDNARDVVMTDWDQDGKLDIIAAAFDARQVSLWLQREFGWLESSWPIGAGSANSLAVGDIDSNGQPDLAYVFGDGSGTSNKIGVVLNRSSDLLVTVETAGLGNPQCVALGDLDDDGDLDVISCEFGSSELNWHENLNGDGVTWVTHSTSPGLGNPADAVAHDVDVDGDLDIVVAGFNRVTWLENRLSGPVTTWLTHIIDDNVTATESVAVGDVDGDGQDEIVAGCVNDPLLAWWDRPTVITNPWTRKMLQDTIGIADVGLEDLDQDGDLDILASKWVATSGGLVYWENDGIGAFQAHELGGTYAQIISTAIGDLDRDGDSDFAMATGNGDVIGTMDNLTIRSSIKYIIGHGGTDGGAPTPLALAAVDLDQDGDLDIVSYDDNLRLRWRDSVADSGIDLQAIGATLNGNGAFSVADMDNDGDMDVVMGLDDGLEWMQNNGFGSIFSRNTIDTASSISHVEVVDLNLDGQLDVVGLNDATGELRWWRNTGGGSGWFENPMDSSVSAFQDMASGDVDGDGDPEVLVASDGAVTAYHRIVDTVFTQTTVSTVDVNILAAEDFDKDGDVDVCGYFPGNPGNSGTSFCWANDGGGGGWTEHSVSAVGDGVTMMPIDVDLDSDLDLVMSGPAATYILINQVSLAQPFPSDGMLVFDSYAPTTAIDHGDFTGDGYPDLVGVQPEGALLQIDAIYGQYAEEVGLGPDLVIEEGTSGRVAEINVEHLGRNGDQGVDVIRVRLQVSSSSGAPLDPQLMDDIFSRVSLYRDDLVQGTVVEIVDPQKPNGIIEFEIGSASGLERVLAPTSPGSESIATFFLVFELEPDAAAFTDTLRLFFPPGDDVVAAEDQLGIPLEQLPLNIGFSVINVDITESGEPPLFADDFESGTTSAWDFVVQ